MAVDTYDVVQVCQVYQMEADIKAGSRGSGEEPPLPVQVRCWQNKTVLCCLHAAVEPLPWPHTALAQTGAGSNDSTANCILTTQAILTSLLGGVTPPSLAALSTWEGRQASKHTWEVITGADVARGGGSSGHMGDYHRHRCSPAYAHPGYLHSAANAAP